MTDSEKPAPNLRVLELLRDGKHVAIVVPTYRLARMAFADLITAACAMGLQIQANTAMMEMSVGTGRAEILLEESPIDRLRGLRFDAAWAPFGMMIDTRTMVNACMVPEPVWV